MTFSVGSHNIVALDLSYTPDLFGIQRNDSKLLHRFGLEIEEILEDLVTVNRKKKVNNS